ncbi:hypothetical protein GCM10012285_04530 [Streptomyces kronopolitis]|uniref:Uncharacterized protein n=1 Tax=Streptomyces kronopolitis TaxID=1612435 RepID=A0ABQ2J0M6_9ACTN|nr:hypothetical protein [Streptomyces kronopolitis]GGN33450.1 hypothetical protein GCM10012285_04530 [Streptomyces kronopolitis]
MAYSPNPYLNSPITPARPRMFSSTLAQVVWTLVPLVSFSLLAAVPFVVAAVKGVIKPWLAGVYVVVEVGIFVFSTAVSGNDPKNWTGLLLILLMLVATTHTALLDSEKIHIGK